MAMTAFEGIFQKQSDSPLIFDTGDHPNSTIGSTPGTGLLASSGNTNLWDMAGNCRVVDGQFQGTGTYYLSARNTATLGGTPSPLTFVGGVFKLGQSSGSTFPVCIMGRDETGTGLDNLTPHIIMGSQGYAVQQRLNGGAFVVQTQNTWKGGELIVGQPYFVGIKYDYANSTVTISLPDGETVQLPSQCQTTLPTVGCWEGVNGGTQDYVSWSKVFLGQSDGDSYRPVLGAASQKDINSLKCNVSQIKHTKSGATSGATSLISFNCPPPGQEAMELIVEVTGAVVSSAIPGCCYVYRKYGVPVLCSGGNNYLGSPRLLDYDAQNPSGVGVIIDMYFNPSISGNVVTIGATPYLGGSNVGLVSAVKWTAIGHDTGAPGGSWSAL